MMNASTIAAPGPVAAAPTAPVPVTPARLRWFDIPALKDRLPAALFVFLWSTGYIAGKVAVTHAAPFTTLTLRFGGATLLFGAIVLARRPQWPRIGPLFHSAVVGLTLAVQFGAIYAAFALGTSPGFSALVIGCMPLTTALAMTAMGEKQGMSQWLGLLLGLAGVLLVLQDRLGSGLGSGLAGLALLLALCGITFGTIYQKRHALELDLNIGLMIQNLVATLVLAPFALLHEHFRFDTSAAFTGSLLWMIFLNSGASFALFFMLLRRGLATRVSTLFYLVTPITAIMGWLLMHEPMSAIKVTGFALAAGGVYLATRNA